MRALATGTPTRQVHSGPASAQGPIHLPPGGPRANPAACELRDVCGPGVRPRRLPRVRTTRMYNRAKATETIVKTTAGPVRWPLLPSAGWFSTTPGLRPSLPHPRKVTRRCRALRTVLTLFGAPAGRSVFSLPAGPDANVEKDGSSASLTAMSDSPGGCLQTGRGRGRSQGATLHRRSSAPHRPSPPHTPRAPRYTYLINVGAQKVLGSSKQWGYPNPKVRRKKRLRNEAKTKNPKLPEILRWIKYKRGMSF